MRIVFWDIDGTLLTTARAGIIAWERAVTDVFEISIDLSSLKTAGLTDTEIAASLTRTANPEASTDHFGHLLRRYEFHLPTCLPLRTGGVLPGVRSLLSHLDTLLDVRCLLLTGNTRAGASAKLSHYGLDHFFADGAFSDGCATRGEVATHAKEMALRAAPSVETIFVVGDTPHDIRCGQSIGAWTIAVATGEYSDDELARHGASTVLRQLPAPHDFVHLLDQAAHRAL
jgi:phosphoglycolate phosphatase-like HAD superfamily hydrolase